MPSANIVKLLQQRETNSRTNKSSQQWVRQSTQPCVELKVWVEGGFMRDCSSQYCDLGQPAPRSTIAAAFSPDGKFLASTHGDHTVKVVDVLTGRPMRQLQGHQRTPWVVRFHPQRPGLLASGSLDHQVRVWDYTSNKESCSVHRQDFGRPIASLAFSQDGEHIAVASGHKLHIWRYAHPAETDNPSVILKTRKSLRAVHFDPVGRPLLLTAEVMDLQKDPKKTLETFPDISKASSSGRPPHGPSSSRHVRDGPHGQAQGLSARGWLSPSRPSCPQVGSGLAAVVHDDNLILIDGSGPPRLMGNRDVSPADTTMLNNLSSGWRASTPPGRPVQAQQDSTTATGLPPQPWIRQGRHCLPGSSQALDLDMEYEDCPPHLAVQDDASSSYRSLSLGHIPTSAPISIPMHRALPAPLHPAGEGSYAYPSIPGTSGAPFICGNPGQLPDAVLRSMTRPGEQANVRQHLQQLLHPRHTDSSSPPSTPPGLPWPPRPTRARRREAPQQQHLPRRGDGDRAPDAVSVVAIINPHNDPLGTDTVEVIHTGNALLQGYRTAWGWDTHQPVDPRRPGQALTSDLRRALMEAAQGSNQEQPCIVTLRLFRYDLKNISKPLNRVKLQLSHVVLCSEMGTHISPCGRYLAACVACRPPGHKGDLGENWHRRVQYELRIYSLESPNFGQCLNSVLVKAAHCLTSVRFSPTSEHILLAYGRRHISLCSFVVVGMSVVPIHTVLEIYRRSDLSLVRVLPSAEDEVNVACFHPQPGGGVVYGTKEGRLRLLRLDRTPPPSQPEEEFEGQDVLDFNSDDDR